MGFDKFVLPELVTIARHILEQDGPEALTNYRAQTSWCGCMGPRPGDRLCPCAQRQTLESNLVEVVNAIDTELARRIMIRKLVAALPG
jgi:hypothetical protein